MASSFRSDLASLRAINELNRTSRDLTRLFGQLASGSSLVRAADDASALGISARLSAQAVSLRRATSNAYDGLSAVRVADGGLQQIASNLGRMRELAVQSANGTLSDSDRESLDAEFQQLSQQIDAIASASEFNGVGLLDTTGSVTLLVGPDLDPASDTLEVDTVDSRAAALGLDDEGIATASDATAAITAIDAAIDQVSGFRGDFAAAESRLDSIIIAQEERLLLIEETGSRLTDLDTARALSALTSFDMQRQSQLSLLVQASLSAQAVRNLL